jgi:hypothetical protein
MGAEVLDTDHGFERQSVECAGKRHPAKFDRAVGIDKIVVAFGHFAQNMRCVFKRARLAQNLVSGSLRAVLS